MPDDSIQTAAAGLHLAADQCVKCGLCLPHCPTYRQAGSEAESPRGRIAMIQALADEQIAPSPATLEHLDACLGCLNCARVCPAKVDYSRIIDAGRALSAQRSGRLRASRSARALTHPVGNRLMAWLLRAYQHSGLQALLRGLRLLPRPLWRPLWRLDAMLPPSRQSMPPAVDSGSRPIRVFEGCTGTVFDQQTLEDSLSLLRRLGFAPERVDSPRCCGAMHGHAGDPQRGAKLAQSTLGTGSAEVPLLTIATGCAAYLQSQDRDSRTQDLSQWLAAAVADRAFQPLAKRWAWHRPCSERNALNSASTIAQALSRIPKLELVPVGGVSGCCGAAGSHLLDRPAQADALVQEYVEQIAGAGVCGVLSTNIGCSLHLRQALQARGLAVPVLHPVSLLARQLR